MIEVLGLTKRFDDVLAVDAIDLVVEPGRIVGLVGINGAGKTTFLRMLAGILVPTSGTVTIAGQRLVDDAIEARRRLAFVPDTPMLFEPLTVHEHLIFVARLYGVADPEPAMDRLLAEFDLADRKRSPAASLSRGMRQKLAICCAFLHEPAALLLDEPLTGLDPPGRKRMGEAVRQRADAGSAVIVSSHQLEFVEKLADHIVIVHRGKVRLSGSLDEIRNRAGELPSTLEEVFLDATRNEPGSAP